MEPFLIWTTKHDRWKAHDRNVPWTVVPSPRLVSIQQESSPRVFEEGDLVLKKRNQAMHDHRGKFAATYEGPYMVKKAFLKGALILADMDKNDFNMPTNSDAVIRCFAWKSLLMHLISIFLCQKKKKKKRTKKKYLYKKVDQKPERVVYTKGEQKKWMRELLH